MNPEAKVTAPTSRGLTALRVWTPVIRYSSFVILLAVFFPFSSSCRAGASPASVLDSATGAVALQGLDGIDCITAYEVEEDSTQVCDNSPNPWNDLDEISLPLNDKAVIPSRHDQETPHFTGTTVAPIALHQPGFVPAFLFPPHSSDSLPGHLHERAPPSLT